MPTCSGCRTHLQPALNAEISGTTQNKLKGVGEGGGQGGHVPPQFQKWGGGHKWVCAPPPLLGRANVLISLFAHILWLKTQFFSKFSWLASLANFK